MLVTIGTHRLPSQLTGSDFFGESYIYVMRDINTFALYGERGHMIGHGQYSSLAELVKAVAHFLTVHPRTSVVVTA